MKTWNADIKLDETFGLLYLLKEKVAKMKMLLENVNCSSVWQIFSVSWSFKGLFRDTILKILFFNIVGNGICMQMPKPLVLFRDHIKISVPSSYFPKYSTIDIIPYALIYKWSFKLIVKCVSLYSNRATAEKCLKHPWLTERSIQDHSFKVKGLLEEANAIQEGDSVPEINSDTRRPDTQE